MLIYDRVTRGIITGTVGAVVQNLYKISLNIFRVPVLKNQTPYMVGVYLIGALLFGVVAAMTLKLLDTRWENVG